MPNLTGREIEQLLLYARGKLEEERYPYAPALMPVREMLEKVDPNPKPEPLPPREAVRAELIVHAEEAAIIYCAASAEARG